MNGIVSMKIKIFFKKRFYLYFSPIKANTTIKRNFYNGGVNIV